MVSGRTEPRLTGTYSSYSANEPQLYIDIDREKAKSAGVALNDVFQTLQIYLGAAYANDITRFGRNWQVNVQAESRFRATAADIGRLQVRNMSGDMVPLGDTDRYSRHHRTGHRLSIQHVSDGRLRIQPSGWPGFG